MPVSKPHYWYLKSTQESLYALNSAKEGLSNQEVSQRQEKYGKNHIAQEGRFTLLHIVWDKFNNFIIYILIAAAIISLFTDHQLEFYVIMIIVLFTVVLGVVQEYSAGKAIDALTKLTAREVTVFRAGEKITIDAQELVPGDIVLLTRGMTAPADMRVLESHALMLDESILHGESATKLKIAKQLQQQDIALTEQDNIVFAGTHITNGSGLGLVYATGLHSELGKISATLKTLSRQKSPLQRKLDRMSLHISLAVLVICGVLFFLLLQGGSPLGPALILIAAIAVSGIPESFPVALTVALSSGVRRMAKKNAILRDLSSVETLGTTTVICTDKTGTLTENKMRVSNVYFPHGKECAVKGKGYEPISEFFQNSKRVPAATFSSHRYLVAGCILCNNADIYNHQDEWKLRGEPTEGALLAFAKSIHDDDKVMREHHPRVYEMPFDPLHKHMITVHEKRGGKQICYLKGAVETVMDKCTHMRISANRVRKISAEDRRIIHKKISSYTEKTLRVLAIARKPLARRIVKNNKISKKDESQIHNGYILEGIIGLEDTIRPEVPKAIQECLAAGVRTVIITGDHKETAENIGRKLGLFTSVRHRTIVGHELETMTDQELRDVIDDVVIFARTTPEHKLRIVKALQDKGHVVAMTGDGVNDAPALKKADIGVSMGKCGTDVARESSNMVLADDSYTSIVHAIEEGRTIYSNIRRFVYYFLTGNVMKVSLMVLAVLLGLSIPLTALMILFINLVNSSLPAFALSVEPTHAKVMRQKPRPTNENLLSSYLLLKILVLVPIGVLGPLLLFIWEINVLGSSVARAQTVVFATIVLMELLHAFNARSLNRSVFALGVAGNKYLLLFTAMSFTLTLMVIYTSFGQALFSTIPLGFGDWISVIFVAVSILIICEIIKLLIASEFAELNSVKDLDIRWE